MSSKPPTPRLKKSLQRPLSLDEIDGLSKGDYRAWVNWRMESEPEHAPDSKTAWPAGLNEDVPF